MRKYVIGFLIGVLFASAYPVYGAVSSMIGKEVQVEYDVLVNGEKLPVKAVAIDGISYTPNRALSDALQAKIGFENNQVIITTDPSEVPTASPQPTHGGGTLNENPNSMEPVNPEDVPATNFTLEFINTQINALEASITFMKNHIDQLQTDELKNLPGATEELEKSKKKLEDRQTELELWKKRKAELESLQGASQ
jgi:hypothetical protein